MIASPRANCSRANPQCRHEAKMASRPASTARATAKGEYPVWPEGVRTYMMTVNAQGTLERIDRALTEANSSASSRT